LPNTPSRTVVFDVSSHGFGHLGQVAPVIQMLVAQHPSARFVVRSTYAAPVVRNFVGFGVELDKPPPEATLVMHGPTIVDAMASAAVYRALHASWDEHLERETARLAILEPAALVADIPYLSLAAAKRLGIPAIALGSLNWLDLYRVYCGRDRDAALTSQIETAYHSADLFLQPRPHMPMADFSNRHSIGPVARLGRQRKDEIRAALGIPNREHVVLVTFGGIKSDEPLQLPRIPGIHWLVASRRASVSDIATDVGDLKMSFIDVIASSDAVLTKVGYCTFVEAACNGVGIVCSSRPDWPESGPYIEWATRNANFALIEGSAENPDGVRTALPVVLNASPRMAPSPSGVAEAVEIIASMARLT
jgi:hypothetical protein